MTNAILMIVAGGVGLLVAAILRASMRHPREEIWAERIKEMIRSNIGNSKE